MKNKENLCKNNAKPLSSTTMKELNVKLAQLELNRKILIPKKPIKGISKRKSQIKKDPSHGVPSLSISNLVQLDMIEESYLFDLFHLEQQLQTPLILKSVRKQTIESESVRKTERNDNVIFHEDDNKKQQQSINSGIQLLDEEILQIQQPETVNINTDKAEIPLQSLKQIDRILESKKRRLSNSILEQIYQQSTKKRKLNNDKSCNDDQHEIAINISKIKEQIIAPRDEKPSETSTHEVLQKHKGILSIVEDVFNYIYSYIKIGKN